jgi:molybdenum cofactor cytidylyltransferase
MRAAAVVLAAGASARMGGPNKLLADLSGSSVLARTLDAIISGPFDEVVVVTGRDAGAVEKIALAAGARTTHNAAFADGMGRSISAGVGVLRDWDLVAIVLGDLPLLRKATIDAVLGAAVPDRIVRPVVKGRPGHPVVFGNRFGPELLMLRDDDGARPLLRRHAGLITFIGCDDFGAVSDADTHADLHALQRSLSSNEG